MRGLDIHCFNGPTYRHTMAEEVITSVYSLGYLDPANVVVEFIEMEDYAGVLVQDEYFIIRVNLELPDNMLAEILCHELIHVYQYQKGMWSTLADGTHTWYGSTQFEDEYDNHPAEILAWGCQKYLAIMAEAAYLQHQAA